MWEPVNSPGLPEKCNLRSVSCAHHRCLPPIQAEQVEPLWRLAFAQTRRQYLEGGCEPPIEFLIDHPVLWSTWLKSLLGCRNA
jgi:hypothetical protein